MTLANKITLFRILLIPVFIIFTIPAATWAKFVAASIFVIACATDPLDGYFARSRSEVSTLGIFLDPLARQAAHHECLCDSGEIPGGGSLDGNHYYCQGGFHYRVAGHCVPAGRNCHLSQSVGENQDHHPNGGRHCFAVHDPIRRLQPSGEACCFLR